MGNSKRVLGNVRVRVAWEPSGDGVGDCAVFLSMGEGLRNHLVDESFIQIPEYSSGDRMAMASTLALFYMQDVLIAPGDPLQIGKVEGLSIWHGDRKEGHTIWKYHVVLECDSEGPGRLIGYRADIGADGRTVLRGIGMKRMSA